MSKDEEWTPGDDDLTTTYGPIRHSARLRKKKKPTGTNLVVGDSAEQPSELSVIERESAAPACKIYDNIYEEPTLEMVLRSKAPFREKCLLMEQMILFQYEPRDSDTYFAMRRALMDELRMFEKLPMSAAELEALDATEERIKNSTAAVMPLRIRILTAAIPDHNKRVLLEKYELHNTYERDEKAKIREYIEWVLKIPEKFTGLRIGRPVAGVPWTSAVARAYLQNIRAVLDAELYGMRAAKERILEIMAMRITNPRAVESAIGLVGPAGVGKCLGPNEKVLVLRNPRVSRFFPTLEPVYDSYITKKACEITTDDVLIGDDCRPRKVLSVCSGEDPMYRIKYEGQVVTVQGTHAFTANEAHVLTLAYSAAADIDDHDFETLSLIDLPIGDFLKLSTATKAKLFLVRRDTATADISGLHQLYRRANTVDLFSSTEIIYSDICMELRMRNNVNLLRFEIIPLGRGPYNGFTLSGNGRFLLGDGVISHNTNLAQALAKAVALPFAKINMGGASDPSHFIGHNYTYIGSSPGVIVKALCDMKSKDGFIYFDEFDKIFAQNAETNKISHTFLHISDPTQQNEFQDQYMPEIKIDLSHITFIYSFNEKNNINPILLNRIPIIEVAGYSFAEKMIIARDYLVPRALAAMTNHTNDVMHRTLRFTDDALAHLIHATEPVDKHGIRTLKHLITEVITKLNILTITDSTAESNPLKLSYSLRKTDITTVDMAVLNALKLRAPENNNYRDMYL